MRAALLVTFFLIGYTFLSAQSTDPYPPTSVPDRIVLTWSGDPTTTQSVTWRTDVSIKQAFAEIAFADANPSFRKNVDTVWANSELLVTNNNAAHFHTATFTNLHPDTLYAYRVGDGRNWSEWFQFRTAATEEKPFAFLYFGDAQNEVKSMWSRCIRQAYSTMPNIDFLLHAGDLINSANRDEEWGEWFYAGGWIYGMKPNIATPGNHEYYRAEDGERYLSNLWQPSFEFPKNGPKGLEETVYYVDYQGTRFISLNTQAMYNDSAVLKAQQQWLEMVLQENPNRWTIVTHHHPVYSTALGRDNEEIRKAVQPIYEKYSVDLVLQGHDHTYGRGYNVQFGKKHKDKGPMYVVSVSGPKMYGLGFDEWLERAASNTQLYQLIRIEGNTLEYEAYTTTGQLYDAFALQKGEDGVNKFIEKAPADVPENLALPENTASRMTEAELLLFQQQFEAYKARKEK